MNNSIATISIINAAEKVAQTHGITAKEVCLALRLGDEGLTSEMNFLIKSGIEAMLVRPEIKDVDFG